MALLTRGCQDESSGLYLERFGGPSFHQAQNPLTTSFGPLEQLMIRYNGCFILICVCVCVFLLVCKCSCVSV